MPVDLDELERLEREAAPAPWKTSLTKVASGEWEYQLAAERGRAVMPYSDFALIAAARNALPDLIAELRTLRARVAEMGRDLDACRVDHADEAYEQGRRDALRGVQGACLFEIGRMEERQKKYGGASWDWEGCPEDMRAYDVLCEVAEFAEEAAR